MGWSCARAAAWVMESFSQACIKQTGNQNTYEHNGKRYFFERSNKEHDDGAITGTIWRFLPDGEHIRRSGSFRIEGDGTVTRAPAFLKAAAKVKCESQLEHERLVAEEARVQKAFAEGAKFVII